jgi:hypothetical protein
MLRMTIWVLAMLCVGLVFCAWGCGGGDDDGSSFFDDDDDNDDNDDGGGPCDELADAIQALIDEVCEDYPDCSICEPVEEGEGEQPTDAECQELLDEFDADAMLEMYETLCDMEQG